MQTGHTDSFCCACTCRITMFSYSGARDGGSGARDEVIAAADKAEPLCARSTVESAGPKQR